MSNRMISDSQFPISKQVDVTEFQLSRLQAAFRKFYGRYKDLICPYNLSLATYCLICFILIVKPFLTH
jgi:hypothetical protein